MMQLVQALSFQFRESGNMKASNRIRIGHVLVASFAFFAIAVGDVAAVRADTVATFFTAGNQDYTYTRNTPPGVPSTLDSNASANPGDVKFGATFFTPQGPYTADISLVASSSATPSGLTVGSTQADFSGSYTITNASASPIGGVAIGGVLLKVSFSNATLTYQGSVTASGVTTSSYSLGGPASITAYLGAPITQPETFSLSLSGATDGGVAFSGFSGNDSSTASAAVVPEPSSFAIACLGALGLIGYGLRRRKGA